MKRIVTGFLVIFLFIGLSCKEEPTKPATDTTFKLTTEDATCTEVYLRLEIGSHILTREVTLKRDSITLFTRTMNNSETIILDTNLLPNKTYAYTAYLLNSSLTSTSMAQTMDTTSHNFTWQTFTLGDGTGSSVLNDVAIINDTLAYAVGEIYQGSIRYNAAMWNGINWTLKSITVNFRGNLITPPLYGIFAFSSDQIWIAASGAVVYGDGDAWTIYDVRSITGFDTLSFTKCWGDSPSSMYFVGRNGSITYYNGSPNGAGTWTKLESGTTVDLEDIYGTPDGREAWACGWKSNTGEGILLRKQDSQWQTLWHSTQSTQHLYNSELLGSLWIGGNKQYFITGSGDVFRHSILDVGIIRRESVNLINYAYRIRGNNVNDIMLVGDAAMIWHFNGATWERYDNLINQDDRLYGLAVSPTMVVAIGRTYRTFPTQALVIIGRR